MEILPLPFFHFFSFFPEMICPLFKSRERDLKSVFDENQSVLRE